MTLNPIKANVTELCLSDGLMVLFSYRTPVACYWHNGAGTKEWYRTDKKWSVTTSRHINQWLCGVPTTSKPQEYFDNLISEAK